MSNCELIELKDLTLVDGIELAPPPPPPPTAPRTPRQGQAAERPILGAVVRLVGDSVRVEEPAWLRRQPGEGHDFQPCSQAHLSWCDLCGEFIWGLYKQSLRCVSKLLHQLDRPMHILRTLNDIMTNSNISASWDVSIWKAIIRLSTAESPQFTLYTNPPC